MQIRNTCRKYLIRSYCICLCKDFTRQNIYSKEILGATEFTKKYAPNLSSTPNTWHVAGEGSRWLSTVGLYRTFTARFWENKIGLSSDLEGFKFKLLILPIADWISINVRFSSKMASIDVDENPYYFICNYLLRVRIFFVQMKCLKMMVCCGVLHGLTTYLARLLFYSLVICREQFFKFFNGLFLEQL